MRVDVTLKGALAGQVDGGRASVDLSDGATVEAVLAALGLPVVHGVWVVNGQPVRRGSLLADGDRVVVYPPQAGG